MKDSGIEWIGEIPDNWEVRRIKTIFKLGRGRVISKEELCDNGLYPVYSSQTKDNGILGYIDTYDFDIDQLTWTTDGANAGTVFLRKGKHNCTNVCGTLQPKIKNCNLNFINYSLGFIALYHKRYDINGFKIMNNEMAEIKIPFPPIEEQKKIADFLDEKCGKIDNIIERENRQIERLKNYKTSLITQTVRQGLNKNVPLKDTGIDWIGSIPSHWQVKKLKYCFESKKGLSITKENLTDEGIPVLSYGQVHSKDNNFYSLNEKLFKFVSPEYLKHNTKSLVKNGDFIFADTSEDYEGCGNCICIRDKKTNFLFAGYHSIILYNENDNNNFFAFLFMSNLFRDQIRQKVYGTKVFSITKKILNNTLLLVPPINEQKEIADYLDRKCAVIDSAIERKEKQTEKLKEYKKSLIYYYVTGKKEVK